MPVRQATCTFKVIVIGPFAAGKTTFIRSISDVPVVGTEVCTTGAEAAVKDTTTVGIEYGTYTIDDGDLLVELVLVGTPGQPRFEHMRHIAAMGADGVVLLIDAATPERWSTARELLDALWRPNALPLVVGVNHDRTARTSAAPGPSAPSAPDRGLLAQARAISDVPTHVRVLDCDVSDPTAARRLLVELLCAILDTATAEEDP